MADPTDFSPGPPLRGKIMDASRDTFGQNDPGPAEDKGKNDERTKSPD